MSAAISQLKIPNIDISGVAFPPALRAKLLKGGFKMTADFDGMSPSELSRGPAHLGFLLCAKLRSLECEEPIFLIQLGVCVCVCGVLVRVVAEAQIGMHDAAEVLRLVRGDPRSAHKRGRSALELLQVQQLFFRGGMSVPAFEKNKIAKYSRCAALSLSVLCLLGCRRRRRRASNTS